MGNLKLTVAYDGTGFHGFQVQPNLRTVQGVLEEGIEDLTGAGPRVTSSGRTDAGVHAVGQVISFQTSVSIPVEKWPKALNTRLPQDVRVLDAQEVSPDFHARYSAKGKMYRYLLATGGGANPVIAKYVWDVGKRLDIDAMEQGAWLLAGEHDFTSFQSAGSTAKTSVRRVTKSQITVDAGSSLFPGIDGLVAYDIAADGFLYNMVRNIMGVLVRVGLGKIGPDEVQEILAGKDRSLAGELAPPQGLWLMRVWY